jgi:hypothetical protein
LPQRQSAPHVQSVQVHVVEQRWGVSVTSVIVILLVG